MKLEKHVQVDTSNSQEKIVDILVQHTSLPKQKIKRAMQRGAVWMTTEKTTKRIRRADKKANKGDDLHLYYNETLLEQQPDPAILISDQNNYSIWYKPYGMLCQGAKWGDHFTINRWVETQTTPHRPCFIVHRLDRATSGLIILAHSKKTAGYFSNIFEKRAIEKHYQAIVSGQFPQELSIKTDIDDKPALTQAKLMSYHKQKDQSLLDIKIETGRKHQIRKHLAESSFPILGDRLYGQQKEAAPNLCLTSCYLSFADPNDGVHRNFSLPEKLKLQLD